MMFSAIGLAALGTALGLVFRWKVLLPIILLVPFAVIILSVSRGIDLQQTVITVLLAEAILQGGYFFGLLIRFVTTAGGRWVGASGVLRKRRLPKPDQHHRPPAPRAEVGKES